LPVDWWILTFAFFTALVAAAINSIAGGGTLLTFPLLIWLGLEGKTANATSTIGLWAGSFAGAVGFREELGKGTAFAFPFFVASLVGGTVGSVLLLNTKTKIFDDIVPWLILTATLLFASQAAVRRWLRAHHPEHLLPTRLPAVVVVQFLVGVYGGYFGAGMGILMLAILGFWGLSNLHQMNGIKNAAATAINGITVLIFITASIFFPEYLKINWPIASVMVLGSIIGGYGCAGLAKRMNQLYLRRAVVVIGLVGAAGTAYKTWFASP
jgi:uncharacterized membrane protein YfcA